MKRAQEEWKHDIVYKPKSHSDLLHDPKGHGDLYGRFDIVYDPKGHCDFCNRLDQVYDPKKGHRVIRGRHDLFI